LTAAPKRLSEVFASVTIQIVILWVVSMFSLASACTNILSPSVSSYDSKRGCFASDGDDVSNYVCIKQMSLYITFLIVFIYIYMYDPCGGGLEYLHRSPASRKRRQKGNPVPGIITGPPCSRGIYIRGPGPSGWGSRR
jgi:hypothetical protein